MAYTTNPPQYVPTFVLGSPVGVPVQPGGGMGAVQASGAQGVHRPMDLVPVSGTVAGQPMMIQSCPHCAGHRLPTSE